MRIGLVSDTHDHFDPRLREIFRGVDHILHAGDIGQRGILVELEKIAPVTAVLGNNDFDSTLRETEVLELAGRKFMVHHIVNPHAPSDTLQRRIGVILPDVLVFGHSHRPFAQQLGPVFFINPGYAGRPRFSQERSVALLHCEDGTLRHEFVML